MKYQAHPDGVEDTLRHLRNKNLLVLPRKRAFLDKIRSRLANLIASYVQRVLTKGGAQVIVSEQVVENSLVLTNLRAEDKTVLDFGGFESLLPLHLSAIG